MDRHDEERPSIFRRPPDDDQDRTHGAPYDESERRTPVPPPAPMRQRSIASPPAAPPRDKGISRQTAITAAMGGALVVMLGIVGFLLAQPDDAATGVVPTASPTAETSATSSPSETLRGSPTPEPTPAGPPAEVAVGGWATVRVDELDVRSAAGPRKPSLNRLVRGAIVNVTEGPKMVRGGSWYRVVSLGGAVGWASSGWELAPYLETIADSPTLRECGPILRPVFDVASGSVTPQDPLRFGNFAVPVAGFRDSALAALELSRGMDQEVCFSARLGANGLPELSTQVDASACGHAQADASTYTLHPTGDDSLPLASQVLEPTVVHPTLLDGGPPDDRMHTNIRTIVSMMANDGSSGCVYANVTQRGGAVDATKSVSVRQCSVVHLYNRLALELSPASGGESVRIKLDPSNFTRRLFPLEEPIEVSVDAYADEASSGVYASPNGPCS